MFRIPSVGAGDEAAAAAAAAAAADVVVAAAVAGSVASAADGRWVYKKEAERRQTMPAAGTDMKDVEAGYM